MTSKEINVPEALEQLRAALKRCDDEDRRDMTIIALGFVIGAAFEYGVNIVALTEAMFGQYGGGRAKS
jgi:hypothetical protein